MADAQSLLSLVESAIEAILEDRFEEFAEGNHRFKNLSLGELREWRKELQREVAAASGGGMQFGSIVPADGG
jgi:hypothetical protein